MDVSFSTWLVILLAMAGANLPFFNDKVFALIALKDGEPGQARRKPLGLRLLELLACYFVVGAIAMMLEARIGNAFAQTWEFYAITGCLFLVFAFPGFVLRYLRKHH
jgi:hypothetical protein